MKIEINNKTYKVVLPVTEEEKREGLSSLSSLSSTRGMIFVADSGKEASSITMNTYEMQFPINMLFVGADRVIKEVFLAKPGLRDITRKNVAFIIELNDQEAQDSIGSEVIMDDIYLDPDSWPRNEAPLIGDKQYDKSKQQNILINKSSSPKSLKNKLKLGGTIDIKTDSVDIIAEAMQVLDDKGNVVMNIFGGERIFSIEHTKEIVDLASKIKDGKEEPEKLGELMKDIIDIHATQKPQYTD